MLTETNSKYQL